MNGRSVPRTSSAGGWGGRGPIGSKSTTPTDVYTRPSRTTSLSGGANWLTAIARSRSITREGGATDMTCRGGA